MTRWGWSGVLVVLLSLGSAGCGQPANSAGATLTGETADASGAAAIRADAWRRARVWTAPAVPIAQANLADNPPDAGAFRATENVSCRFVRDAVGGTTPKFNCALASGEVVRIKYGYGNPELHAEVAATRLLAALGFGADRMFLVRAVECTGCPRFPFQALRCYQTTGLDACFGGIDDDRVVTFGHAVVERKMAGAVIKAPPYAGWAWYELPAIDPSAGGSSRTELDALRLIAMLLAHWDNKSENQRLICLPGGERPDGACGRPFALIQDLGASFGPIKLDLRNWRAASVWSDARRCTVTMKPFPWGGGTFPDHQISEEGRLFFLHLVEQLSEAQIEALFASSGVTSHDQIAADARDPRAWTRAFMQKVRAIREAGPCPGTS